MLETLTKMKKASGMTTAEIARRSGVPEPTLVKLFAGVTKNPSFQTIQRVTQAMGFTTNDLCQPPEELVPRPAPQDEPEDTERWLARLLVDRGYLAPGEDITEAQAAFLIHWAGMLDAWFERKGE
mgnify:CR=1